MARVIATDLILCTCCTSVAANADDSGCRDFHGHPEHALQLLTGHVIVGEGVNTLGEAFATCDGCGLPEMEIGSTGGGILA